MGIQFVIHLKYNFSKNSIPFFYQKLVLQISATYAVEAFDVLFNDVLPIVDQLENNSSSSNILYNTQSAERMIDLMNDTKPLLIDATDTVLLNGIK